MRSLTIREITKETKEEVANFLERAGDSLSTFTYFEKRKPECLENHLLTAILFDGKKGLAYGHLNREKEDVWLDVCVLSSEKRKGYGSSIMKFLLEEALIMNLTEVKSSINKTNEAAINLFKKFGFEKNLENNDFSLFLKVLPAKT